jgi:hypothetical protein
MTPHTCKLPSAIHRTLLSLLASSVLLGCASLTRTPYQPPAVSLPTAWSHASTPPQTARDAWWHAYGDAQLDQLIAEALAHNPDLAVAAITLNKARLQAELAGDKLRPTVAASLSGSGSKVLTGNTSVTRDYASTLSVTYEADLWGKLASARDTYEWEARATEQDKESTALALIGNTAKYPAPRCRSRTPQHPARTQTRPESRRTTPARSPRHCGQHPHQLLPELHADRRTRHQQPNPPQHPEQSRRLPGRRTRATLPASTRNAAQHQHLASQL